MFQEIKRFFRHSVVYAGGNIIHRGAAFILLPLYTHYLTPADYGMLSLFYVTANVVRTLLSMGISHATLRFYFEYDSEAERRLVIGTSLAASLVIGALGIGVILPFLGKISELLFHTPKYAGFFRITLTILLLELMMEVSRAFIRAKERSLLFVGTAVLQLLAQVSCNVVAVVVLRKGVEGILWGNLTSVTLVWLVLTAITLRYSGFRFDGRKLKAVLKYSLPLVPATLITMIALSVDRYLLTRFSTLSVVGLYSLALNFGVLVTVALMDPFGYSFGPYRFSIMKQANAKEIYARILTYYVAVLAFLCLGLSVFAKEILQVIASAEFQAAHTVVPLICLGFLFMGPVYVLQTGIYVTKKTRYIFHVSVLKAFVLVSSVLLLVPGFNMYGAAAAKVIAGAASMAATWWLSNRVYPMAYEWRRIGTVFVLALAMYGVSLGFISEYVWLNSVLKLVLVSAFPFVLGVLGFYTRSEIEKAIAFVRHRKTKIQGALS